MRLLLFSVLLFSSQISAVSPTEISFQDDLALYHQQEIKIRGFLYQTDDARWILASTPDLKSCCVGSHSKIAHQIVVSGDFDHLSTSQAVTLQGKFVREPLEDAHGNLKQLYRFDHARIVSGTSKWPGYSVILAGIVSAAFAFHLFRKQKGKMPHA
jgi:hypothetical protein